MPFAPSEENMDECDTIRAAVFRARARWLDGPDEEAHVQVRVQTPSGPAEVDEGIVTLLQKVWALGVDTFMSCQNSMDSVWLCFELGQFQRLHQLARLVDDLAYFLDEGYLQFHCATPEHWNWEYTDDDEPPAGSPPRYHVSVRFPHRHRERFEGLLDRLRVEMDRRAAQDAPVRKRARTTR
jgi:hypothetical protein